MNDLPRAYSGRQILRGLIALWYGSIASIPSGWALCNGAGGTPDLRDKFIVGAGSTYAPGTSGGATTHLHSVALNHTHATLPDMVGSGMPISPATPSFAGSVNTGSGSSLPPYYALAYIMKL